MGNETPKYYGRRRALALIGGGTMALTFLGLAGCGRDDPAPRPALATPEPNAAPPPKQPEVKQVAKEPANASSAANSDGGSPPRLDENSTQAQNLAYVEDASTLSTDSQPRYAAGQNCGNCALYQGGDAEWGPCPLFQGKQVAKAGWCNAYVRAS